MVKEFILNNVAKEVYQSRENREGWPLLTFETGANGDLWSTNEKGPSLVGPRGLVVLVREIFILPWLL